MQATVKVCPIFSITFETYKMSNPSSNESEFKRILELLTGKHEKSVPEISRRTGISIHVLNAARLGRPGKPRPFRATEKRLGLLRAYLEKVAQEGIELPEDKLDRLEKELVMWQTKYAQQEEHYERVIDELERRLKAFEKSAKKEKERNGA